MIEFVLDGHSVHVPADAGSLLDALRDHLNVRTVKDGCSPQGQCGCCTVWVDGQARVACVTPVARVAGRQVTTLDGLPDAAKTAIYEHMRQILATRGAAGQVTLEILRETKPDFL